MFRLLGLTAAKLRDFVWEEARTVFRSQADRWRPLIESAGEILESVFTDGLQATLENLQGAAADKLGELKTAATDMWSEIKTDFGGFLVDKMKVAVPELLQSVLLNLTPARFLSVLDLIVDRCGDAGEFLDRMTGAVRAAQTCGAGAVQTIADHTKGFVSRFAASLLGAAMGVLVGNLPQRLAEKLREFTKGIQDLVRKLIRKLLEKLKTIFGRRGAQGQTDAEGFAPACANITVRKNGARRPKSGSCFVPRTPVHTPEGTRPIETVALGSRVLALQPEERDLIASEEVEFDDRDLRVVRLRLARPASGESHIGLLRGLDWIDEHGARLGGTIFLNMPEMGVEGEADVLGIEACPPAEPGEGRLVTGTVRHTSGEVYDLTLASEGRSIGVTATHPFWSVDRNGWVPAIDLHIGETVKTLTGTTVVESIHKKSEPEAVYNLEVEGDHVYWVGESGVLVHNTSAPSGCCDPREGYVKSRGMKTSTDVSWLNNGSATIPVAAEGLITAESVEKGGAEFDTGPTNPAWWRYMTRAFPEGDWARGHLIGNALGGPGEKEWWNMVPLHRRANNPGMWNCEKKIRDAAREGHCIKLTVTPIYGNRKVIPSSIKMEAVSLNSNWKLGPVNVPNQLAANSPC